MGQFERLHEKRTQSDLLFSAGWIVGRGVWYHPEVDGAYDLDGALMAELERRWNVLEERIS